MMDWKSHDSRVFTSPVGTRRTKLSASGTLRALRGEIGVSEKKKGGEVEARARYLPAGHCVDVGSAHWVGDVAQELHGPR